VVSGSQLLGALLGSWSLNREIAAEGARMTGRAVFAEEPGGSVLYREEGMLTLGTGTTINAHRQYRFREADGALLIDFADGADHGRRFVTLRFSGEGLLVAHDVHPCGPDWYDVTYRLSLPHSFETDITRFTRLR
jgi:hypothetical protein